MKANSDISTIATLTQLFADHKHWSISTMSLRAAGKGTFVADLTAGRVGITVRRRDRIIQWFADNWPDDLEWPRQIPRPSKSKEAA